LLCFKTTGTEVNIIVVSAAAFYSTLALKGCFSREQLKNYRYAVQQS